MNTAALAGMRILVVEDEAMIALVLEATLVHLGVIVLGPVARLSDALDIAQSQEFDGAILDVTIRGGHVYPVAEILMARGIPFTLAAGYAVEQLPANLRGQTILRKPYSTSELTDALNHLAETKLGRMDQP